MRNAVLRGFIIITLFGLCILSLAFCCIYAGFNLKQTENRLLEAIRVIDCGMDYEGDLEEQAKSFNSLLDSETRLTLIAPDGSVPADTAAEIEDDNHLDRPEVLSALKNGSGANVRYSRTMGRELIYAAALSPKSGYVIRLSTPYRGKLYMAGSLIPALLLSCCAAFILSLLLSRGLTDKITGPLTQIYQALSKARLRGEEISLDKCGFEEIDAISEAISTLSKRVEKTIEDIHREKQKTAYILDSMQEGLILLDENRRVMTINKAAAEILDCKSRSPGKDILYYTQSMEISEGVDAALATGAEQSFDLTSRRGRIYNMLISRVSKSKLKHSQGGIIIFMPEVTKDRAAESMRQEFFSNASHELKTPITSIQGYAELLTSGISYTEEQKEEFLRRIQKEAANMTALINDILTISRLEASSQNEGSESPVSLPLLVDDIFRSTEPMAAEKGLSLYSRCGGITVKADYRKLYQLLNNLIVNAVKYNKQGGTVTVSAEYKPESGLTLAVADTGIGIPADSRARVFERFYRVDKGRSKKTAGTGLGLAIVKHIVSFYHGSIHLESEPDKGTEVRVNLPLEEMKQ